MASELRTFDPRPVTLESVHARLEPLDFAHASDLLEAGREPEIWLYMPIPPFQSLDDVTSFIEMAQANAQTGNEIPFAIVDRANGRAVGSTRYLDIRRADRALEIGWTWLGASARRTPINTECKYVLLRHAFETLGAVRVQLKTDARNIRSQNAIERIGAKREGTLRKHVIRAFDGFIRDSVMFSIIDDEWPAVKARLQHMLSSGVGQAQASRIAPAND